MTDLAPAELALRVGIFAGLLGFVVWLPGDLQWLITGLLVIVSLIFFYEIWAARAARRKQRDALVWALLSLAAAVVLAEGWARAVSTPLFALGAVCVALWFVGTLGQSDDDGENETLH